MGVPKLTLQVRASVVALLVAVLAVVAPVAGQNCPVAVGPGCDRILLTVNGVQKDGTAPADYPVNWKMLSIPMGLRSAGESGSAQPWLSGYKSIDNWLAQNQRNV